jgi:hypothetical protein
MRIKARPFSGYDNPSETCAMSAFGLRSQTGPNRRHGGFRSRTFASSGRVRMGERTLCQRGAGRRGTPLSGAYQVTFEVLYDAWKFHWKPAAALAGILLDIVRDLHLT